VQPVSDFCRDGCVMEGTSDVRKRKKRKGRRRRNKKQF
jgi:hypothetical protein